MTAEERLLRAADAGRRVADRVELAELSPSATAGVLARAARLANA